MPSAARRQPESEQVDVVVSVRDDSFRQLRTGLVMSLCLLALLAIRPDWQVLGGFGVVELVTGVYVAVRGVFRFRSRLDEAEPLPTEAVERIGRAEQPPLDLKRTLVGTGVVLASIGGVVAFDDVELIWSVVVVAIAVVIADLFVRPLAVTLLASRWERAHGHARLFRSLEAAEDGNRLYVADRPVPAA
jgi:hypothetical protein